MRWLRELETTTWPALAKACSISVATLASVAENTSFGRVARLALFDHDVRHGRGRLAAQVPLRGVAVLLARRAVAGPEPGQVEPGMILQELDEMLAHHSGGAENSDFDSSFHIAPFTTR